MTKSRKVYDGRPIQVVYGNVHQPDYGPNRIGFWKLWRNPTTGWWWFLKRPGKVEYW